MEDLQKQLEELMNKTAKAVNESVNYVANKVDVEKNKLDIKSQIGYHQRTLRNAYTRLGEAYFQSLEANEAMVNNEDLLEVIKTNKKVIYLLEEQLKNL
ncbi:MAG: hypothetical protein MR210_06685 [Erysipelotrichaceae bacterium]|nr:hypothetical protein [Erysipelotrichaceae bacterium]MDY5252848.1 hypothetical protein [Erysipelotrichaceae bacterium]